MRGTRVAGVGVVTGWGPGVAALPDDARQAARGRRVVRLDVPRPCGDRFRRTTRECLLGIAAVEALLVQAGVGADRIAGSDTALVYVTASAYGASNRAFIDAAATGSALHFPYTAPSAVPAEVSIEFGLTGSYVILIGGAAATIDALWQASLLVARGSVTRALVLAVETFAECEDLWRRGRGVVDWPLTEAAACALVVQGEGAVRYDAVGAGTTDDARRRAGETLAVGPLIALALADREAAAVSVSGAWRRRTAAIRWSDAPRLS